MPVFAGGTRAIVFAQFRHTVVEISQKLAEHSGLLRPAIFIGQQSTNSMKGLCDSNDLTVYLWFSICVVCVRVCEGVKTFAHVWRLGFLCMVHVSCE